MKTYIYPENLRANVKLWFWSVRDFIIICTGVILSVVSLVYLLNILPAAATLCYAFVSFRPDENSILDFIVTAFRSSAHRSRSTAGSRREKYNGKKKKRRSESARL